MNSRIDELTKKLYEGSTKAFAELEQLRMIVINVKIATAKLDGEEARALSKTGEIITESLVKLQESTKMVRDVAKEIARENAMQSEENKDGE